MLVLEQNTESVTPRLTNDPIVYPSVGDETRNFYASRISIVSLNTDLLGYLINKEQVHTFLSKNIDVFLIIPDVVQRANEVIGSKIVPDLEIINDDEIPEQDRLALMFKIKNKSYQEILDMWNVVSKKAYENLDISTSKKMSVILDGE